MSISRRDLLVYGAGIGAALPLLANLPAAHADGGGDDGDGGNGGGSTASEAARRFAGFAEALQCAGIAPLPLLTGDNAVNGGLRFDDEMAAASGLSKVRFQRAIRVGDIEHRTDAGVLPMFTIGCIVLGDADPQTQPYTHFDAALHFLIHVCRLPRESLSFTTTDVSLERFASAADASGSLIPASMMVFGLPASTITLRPHGEAVGAGDGSGWFFDPRNGVGVHTVSIECTRDGLTLELGEVWTGGFGFGMERLQWAMGGSMQTWNQALPRALSRIRAEARRAHVPLPPGYALLAASGG